MMALITSLVISLIMIPINYICYRINEEVIYKEEYNKNEKEISIHKIIRIAFIIFTAGWFLLFVSNLMIFIGGNF